MKIKVGFFNKILIGNYLSTLAVLSTVFSLFSIGFEFKNKICWIIFVFVASIILYLIYWVYANVRTKKVLKIGSSILEVKIGDIFNVEGLKVIAFNEYFDTLVDNKIISENTVNGIYLKNKINDIAALDKEIIEDESLSSKIVEEVVNRKNVKKNKYKLGTIFQKDDYLLTSFSKFDYDNRAYLTINDYINFLMNFWNEIDIIYAGRSVNIPLLGSGITRIKGDENISEQELLELLIWSFKVSRIKFTYPSKVTILIHETKKDKIDFYSLKGE